MKKSLSNKVSPALMMLLSASTYIHAEDSLNDSDVSTIAVVGGIESPDVVRLKNLPVTSVVIGSEELNKVKFTNPTELLNRIPGVSMSRNLRIPRGDKGYTIPLVDGFSLRNPYRGSISQIEDNNIEDIERIDLIYGPSSALYGSNAFGGVVNVITAEPPEEQENRVWVEAGDHDRLRTGASTTGTLKDTGLGDVGYVLDISRWDIGGYRNNTDDDRTTGSGKLVFHPTNVSKLWVRGEYLDRVSKTPHSLTQAQFNENEKQSPARFGRPPLDSFSDSETHSASIGYVTETAHGEFKTGFSYRNDKGFNYAGFRDPNDFDLVDMDFKTQYRHDFKKGNELTASLTTGLEIVKHTNETVSFTDETKATVDEDENIDFLVYAPFAQLELFPFEKTKVTLGLRYEEIKYEVKDNLDSSRDDERKFAEWAPKLGVTYDLNPDHMIFAGISRGFAPPSDGSLFSDVNADPSLDAEIADNYEIGMRGDFASMPLSYDVALYYLNITDFIVSEDLGFGQTRPINAGKVNFRGLEAQLAYTPIDYLKFDVAYTFARNKFVEYTNRGTENSGNFMSSSPKHHVNARMTLTPMENLDVELEMDVLGSYYTNNTNDADPEGKYTRDNLYNLRVSYETGPIETWFTVLNLTDEKHATRVSYSTRGAGSRSFTPGDARTIYMGMAYNF